nr:oligopeptide transporter 4 [Quercus suber]
MWFLGLISCALLSFLNQFFAYRTEPLVITQITVQVATLPIGRFMASVLPKTKFQIPGFGSRSFSLNPGPFNMKEHVLISIFANAGSAFGSGSAYAVGIVNIIKAFYHRNISFFAAWLLIITTQVLGYGWAGLLRKYVVEPAHMWWPDTLVQVSLFRALHENEKRRMSRAKFFLIALICSFSWYLVPGYLFTTLTSISWVCWVFSKSVTAQQIGSGMRGLGLGALTLDWSVVASFLSSPLVSPFFSIVNVFAGYFLIVYIAIPIGYWGLDLFGARRFPIFSSHLFTAQGQAYNISAIVNDKFELNLSNYEEQGRIHLSMLFSLIYGFGFATIASTLTHVALFYGRYIPN